MCYTKLVAISPRLCTYVLEIDFVHFACEFASDLKPGRAVANHMWRQWDFFFLRSTSVHSKINPNIQKYAHCTFSDDLLMGNFNAIILKMRKKIIIKCYGRQSLSLEFPFDEIFLIYTSFHSNNINLKMYTRIRWLWSAAWSGFE